MVEIEQFNMPLSKYSSKAERHDLVTTSLGYFVSNEWTSWADQHLLRPPKIFKFIRPTDYSFWLKWFHNFILYGNSDEKPLRRHIPEIVDQIGMKPLWAMSCTEKGFYRSNTGVPFGPKIFRNRDLWRNEIGLSSMGIELSENNSDLALNIERECFPDMSHSLDNLKPSFVERLSLDEKLLIFSVLTFDESTDRWLLRVGNQLDLSENWHTDFSLQIPELNTENLYVEDRFARTTERILKLQRPIIVELNDPVTIAAHGYGMVKLN